MPFSFCSKNATKDVIVEKEASFSVFSFADAKGGVDVVPAKVRASHLSCYALLFLIVHMMKSCRARHLTRLYV